MTPDELEFLEQSNFIEGVTDSDSLSQAVYAWKYLKDNPKLTASVVLKTHKILMLHQKLYPDEKGYFRKVPVWIGGREGKPWYVISELIENWCREVEIDILGKRLLWKQRHVEYEEIHPFVDGNGRTGRMFMNWQRLKQGLPLLIIHEGDEQLEYYKWFRVANK